MQKITPHLWFDTEATQAAEFYTSVFSGARITHASVLKDTPSGDCDVISFEIGDTPFMAISAGPYFKINPSISFFVNFDPSRDANARAHLDEVWAKLSAEGTVRMALEKYPFSEHYGWVEDKYGVNWQLMLTNPSGEPRPFIVPSMMFTKDVAGKADEALDFYVSVFKGAPSAGAADARRGTSARYPAGMEPEKEGTLMYADFCVLNTWIAAMDSAGMHDFVFNEGVSLLIPCDTQEEIDYYWEKLSAVKEAEQCGWLKDKFNVSWQVHPALIETMTKDGSQEQVARMMAAFMHMRKPDIAALKAAFDGTNT